jgi:hypothetical protein
MHKVVGELHYDDSLNRVNILLEVGSVAVSIEGA